MSSRTYLFTAIACVMLAIAAGQWAMFHFLSQDIANQVREQSKNLSKELAVFAADAMNINLSGNDSTSTVLSSVGENYAEVNIKLSDLKRFEQEKAAKEGGDQLNGTTKRFVKSHMISIDEQGEVTHDVDIRVGADSNEMEAGATIEREESVQPKILKKVSKTSVVGDGIEQRVETISQLVRSQIEATELHFDSKQDMQSVWVFHSSDQDGAQASKRIEIQDNTNMLLDQLKQMGLMIMVITWLLGIGFIYWISHQFTAPLRALDAGYQSLSEGDMHANVPVKGTAEIQQAIRGFNHMTTKLAFYQQQQNEIKDKMHLAEIGEISRGIAHALRNPLHTIGLALDKVFGQSPSRYESGIRQKLKLMDKTIQALLNLSVSGVERKTEISIKPIIQDIIMEMQLTEGVDVRFDVVIEPELRFIGSESEVRNMLHTLIVNAVEASPEHSKITVKAHRSAQDKLVIVVEDQGKGISGNVMESLFEPHITTKAEGAGMGLYIARRLAQLMYNGEIQIHNKKVNAELASGYGCVATLVLNDANKVITNDEKAFPQKAEPINKSQQYE
jgi:signal transduction histidine kinase